jgi:hypothetical protein
MELGTTLNSPLDDLRHNNNTNSRIVHLLQTALPITVTSRYAGLSNLSESPLRRVEAVSEEVARSPTFTTNNKTKKNQRGANYSQNWHHPVSKASTTLNNGDGIEFVKNQESDTDPKCISFIVLLPIKRDTVIYIRVLM